MEELRARVAALEHENVRLLALLEMTVASLTQLQDVLTATNAMLASTAERLEAAQQHMHVGDPLPNALNADELMRALNLPSSTFYAHQKAGKLKRFEFRRPVSHTKRYSGALVTRYLTNPNL